MAVKIRASWLLLGLAGAALVGAVGYRLGSSVPAAPPAALPNAPAAEVPALIARLETRTKDNPDDVEAWRGLGWAYFSGERYGDAAAAYARAAALAPKRSDLWSAMGEARVLAAGTVDAEAHKAFATALALDPKDPRSRYFLGVEKDMAGDHKGAVADWIALLHDALPGADWAPSVRDLVAQVSAREKIDVADRLPPPPVPVSGRDVAGAAIPGPSADQMAAASKLTPDQQNAMVQGMVASLAERLRRDPGDADGWIRLIRSYSVLGDRTAAGKALSDARRAFAGDAEQRRRIDDAAGLLGISAG